MPYVTVIKDIYIDLAEFETKDLVDELSRRKADVQIPFDPVIAMLKKQKAPDALIELLDQWNRVAVANSARLVAWMAWAGR